MGIYDYMNHFWFENENDPCSLSEATLYFYLLYEVNRQHWASPFKVSTQMLAARLNTSKQNVMKARDGLRKRGLIDFSKGEGKGKPALYPLCLSEEQSQSLSQLMTQQLTESLASELPQSLPHSNIKEKNTTKEVGEEKQSPSSNSKVVLTLSELMEKLLNDNSWLLGLSERLADCREYVFNWIKYKYKNYYGNESKCNGQISTIKIEANRPEDYTGYC